MKKEVLERHSRTINTLIIGMVLGFAFAMFLYRHQIRRQPAMTQTDVASLKWPDSLDAVKAAPRSHRVIFENDKIRILEVVLEPHMAEPMHTHRYPSVMFGSNNGDTSQFDIVYYRYAYDSLKHKYIVKDSIPQHHGGTKNDTKEEGYSMKPEGPHSITNLSNVKIDAYRIEFKSEN